MTIRVKFFASLRERYGVDEIDVTPAEAITVDQIWQQVTQGQAMPPHALIAINMEYVERGTPVRDGDEVAYFPPVTGG